MKYRAFLTDREYQSLPYPGQVTADYWAEFLPKMCKILKEEGELLPLLQQKGERLAEMQEDLMKQGLAQDQAWEFVKEDIYSLQPEVDEDSEEYKERLEEELRYQWTMSQSGAEREIPFEQYRKNPENIARAKEMMAY